MANARRHDGRLAGQLRPTAFIPGYVRTANGSCLVEMGGTRVICTASFTEGVRDWRTGSGLGWVTAEYGMLPASTAQRKGRPTTGRPDNRGAEIQRMISRVLRTAVRFDRLGENTIVLDCDVLEADGGTRTASVNGACVALAIAADRAAKAGLCDRGVLATLVTAVSVGVVDDRPLLDLDYLEDSAAQVDLNVAMCGQRFVEIQGTAEREPFDHQQLQQMLQLARKGIRSLLKLQKEAIAEGINA